MARTQPNPPSVVAEPPRHTMIFFAPRSSAWSMSSPVPVVEAAMASLPAAPPTNVSPEARAISMTAVPRWSRHSACTASPNGPVTVLVRLAPPSASRVPSPPSATGCSTHSWPSSQQACPIAAATCPAVAVPLNLSTAASTRIRKGYG